MGPLRKKQKSLKRDCQIMPSKGQTDMESREHVTGLIPVCFAYLTEMVVLSNGDVTTCCLDSKGVNTVGNINEMPIDNLWQERLLPWHQRNVEANLRGATWNSGLCEMCLDNGYMSGFNAKKTDDVHLHKSFNQFSQPFPSSMVLEPTSICNYSCGGCHTGLRQLGRKGSLDIGNFRQNILPVIHKIKQVRLYNYGEPFCHPQISEIIESLRAEGPSLVLHISSNGMLMNKKISEVLLEAQVNYLILSCHGGHTQEGMIKYSKSGPNIEVIRLNVEHLVRLKRSRNKKLPWIFLKAILFSWNDSEAEMEGFLKFGRELGVDFTGWGLNNSDPTFSSRRVAPGTHAYQSLLEKRVLEQNFYELPAWPSEKHVV
jgi:MoaA/NifB/PqqE/SkfB family radical SAM enzyme